MELDLEGQHADRAYPILASLVTPRLLVRTGIAARAIASR